MNDHRYNVRFGRFGLQLLIVLMLVLPVWSNTPAPVLGYPEANVPSGARISHAQTSDIAIVTTENGQSVVDACYVLVDFSNVGCDDNRDGKITFREVPLGSYTVRQVADLGPNRWVDDFRITVTGSPDSSGFERFFTTIATTSGAAPATSGSSGSGSTTTAPVDIYLITREPAYGSLLTGACYQLLGYSNIGCDENGDGQVAFAAIPPGVYTVRQMQTPAGYPTTADFDIVVGNPYGVTLGYVVNQAWEQHAPGARNVSVVFVDSYTHTKLLSSICVQFVGGSYPACDDNNGDGQIDFQGVPLGIYQMAFSGIPSGWQVLTTPTVAVDSGTGPQFVFVEVSVPDSIVTGAIAVIGDQQESASTSNATSSGAAVEIILDTSDSMNELDQNGQTRIDIAKTVATRLVTETLPAGIPMALRTYSGCSSFLTVPLQPLDPNAVSTTIAHLGADGKTPIDQSLRAAGNDLANISGQKIIVLITDGDETCNGDPRAAIDALVARDINVHVNIVGFEINNAALAATFQEWARAGNGAYYPASNELELHQAITTAAQLAFHVIDQNGMTIANGPIGGAPVVVPPGIYTVEIDTVPVTRLDGIRVSENQTTTIDLDAIGVERTASPIANRVNGSGSSSG